MKKKTPTPNNYWLQAYVIIALASFFYIYEFFIRVAPSAITHDLMRDFATNAAGLGLMSSTFYYAYALMQIPAGMLCDHYGPKVMLTISILLCGLATYIFSLSQHLFLAGSMRFIIGMAASTAFIGPLLLASRWFKNKYFAYIAGLIQMMGCIGAIVGGEPIDYWANRIGWRHTIELAGLIGIIFSLLFWVILRDRPKKPINPEPKKMATDGTAQYEWLKLKTILKHPQSWANAAVIFSCWAPVVIFELWGIAFIQQWHHSNVLDAANAMDFMWLGIAISSPIVGWWSNHIGSRRIPMIACAALGIVSSLLIIYAPQQSWHIMYGLLFLLGCSAGSQPVCFGFMHDLHPPEVAGTAVGFTNMACVLGALLQPIIGTLLSLSWDGNMMHGAPLYHLHNYQIALSLMPLCSLFGLWIAARILIETNAQPQYLQTS